MSRYVAVCELNLSLAEMMRNVNSSGLDMSVVIPTYNGAQWIERAVHSVLTQTSPPVEIVIVDDASTDDTVEKSRLLASQAHVPIRIVSLSRNSGGPAKPMNVGVGSCGSTFISLLDQDDSMAPTKLDRLGRLMLQSEEIGLAFGQYEARRSSGELLGDRSARYAQFPPLGGELTSQFALERLIHDGNEFGGAGGMAFRRSAWAHVGGFDETYHTCWDYDFALRVVLAGWKCGYHPQTVYTHIIHDNNLERTQGGLAYCRELTRLNFGLARNCYIPSDLSQIAARRAETFILGAAYLERNRGRLWSSLQHYVASVREGCSLAGAAVGICKLGLYGAYMCIVGSSHLTARPHGSRGAV